MRPRRKTLSPVEIEDISQLMEIDINSINILSKLLSVTKVRELLIKNEYKILVKESNSKKQTILNSLGKKYRLSRSSIEAVIYSKERNRFKICTQCGAEVSQYKHIRYVGLCKKCYIINET